MSLQTWQFFVCLFICFWFSFCFFTKKLEQNQRRLRRRKIYAVKHCARPGPLSSGPVLVLVLVCDSVSLVPGSNIAWLLSTKAFEQDQREETRPSQGFCYSSSLPQAAFLQGLALEKNAPWFPHPQRPRPGLQEHCLGFGQHSGITAASYLCYSHCGLSFSMAYVTKSLHYIFSPLKI